ncbi:MAG: DUF302 domain-containing protein [Dehalococcoidales bacterium]|nr:DUF302 domain-containing protein [Dehalococcoidales bacterium]
MIYGYKKQVNLPYEIAVEKTRQALKKEGFGIITDIDVKAVVKNKLNINFEKYIILGACNPSFTHKALELEKDLGLLMPCNVVVYEGKGKTFVVSTRPTVTMGVVGNPQLAPVASQVEEKLKNAVDNV